MVSVFYTILIATTLISTLRADLCTKLCNLEGLVSPTTDILPFTYIIFLKYNIKTLLLIIQICGTDYNTYKAPLSAIVGLPPPWSCYRQCKFPLIDVS